MEWDLERRVREFVIQNFVFEDDGSLQGNTSFLDSGIIDSTGVLELIEFLERSYGVKIEDQEIIPENLDSVSNIVSFLRYKLGDATVNLRHSEVGQ